MFVAFGPGKCPLCGDFGKDVGRKTFQCKKCDISFNDFLISKTDVKEYNDLYWN